MFTTTKYNCATIRLEQNMFPLTSAMMPNQQLHKEAKLIFFTPAFACCDCISFDWTCNTPTLFLVLVLLQILNSEDYKSTNSINLKQSISNDKLVTVKLGDHTQFMSKHLWKVFSESVRDDVECVWRFHFHCTVPGTTTNSNSNKGQDLFSPVGWDCMVGP